MLYIHTHTHIHTYVHIRIHSFIHTYIHTYIHTSYIHTSVHTYVCMMYVRTYISVLTLVGINFLSEIFVVNFHYDTKCGWHEVLHRRCRISSAVTLPPTEISLHLIPFEVVLLALIQRFQLDFHDRKHFWNSFCVSVLITFYDTVWISIMLSKRRPLSLNFIFGNRKKSQLM